MFHIGPTAWPNRIDELIAQPKSTCSVARDNAHSASLPTNVLRQPFDLDNHMPVAYHVFASRECGIK